MEYDVKYVVIGDGALGRTIMIVRTPKVSTDNSSSCSPVDDGYRGSVSYESSDEESDRLSEVESSEHTDVHCNETRSCNPKLTYGGSITIIIGPMWSGKTSDLMRRVRREIVAKSKCLTLKHTSDVRYSDDSVVSHDLHSSQAIGYEFLMDAVSVADAYDCVGIDEGQFFPDLAQFCELMANRGKVVIVAALDATFDRVPFPETMKVVAMAENVIKLTSVCMVCHKSASFSKRLSDEKEVNVVGGKDKYQAVCRRCFFAAEK